MSKNMYKDRKAGISTSVGCNHKCGYCINSFQKQMKRFMPTIDKNGKKRGCQLCYDFIPHSHPERLERLKKGLLRTYEDEFIWINSSGDIAFAEKEMMEKTLDIIRTKSDRTFFFQTKNPLCYFDYNFPDNCLLGITLETNRNEEYKENKISKAPSPSFRKIVFSALQHRRKVVTIEPILDFDLDVFIGWIRDIDPERVYIGYDTKKCGLFEPELFKTHLLIKELKKFTKVKTKLLREKLIPQHWRNGSSRCLT